MVYPPYCDICVVNSYSFSKENAENVINDVFSNIKKLIEKKYSAVKLIILGPTASSIPKVNNKYRFRIIIKCKNNAEFRDMLRQALDVKLPQDSAVSVDINPETVI